MIEILNIRIVTDEEQDSINRQMLIINDLISRYYSSLTADEIKEAMRLYVFRQFPEIKVFRLIDAVSVGEILKAYIEHRNEVVKPFIEKRTALLNAPAEKTESEKEQIFKDFVKMVFSEVKEKNYCADAWFLFQKLEDKEKIVKSNDEKQELYLKELNIYVSEERKRIKEKYGINHKGYLADFEKTYSNGKRNVYVKNRCRSILVSEFISSEIQSIEELLSILK